jgi:hypothetical protein
MNEVILITDQADEILPYETFTTVTEAQAHAESLAADKFEIYTLYVAGQRPIGINWKLAVDTATNLRENKKSKKVTGGMRRGTWTDTEEQTLRTNFEAGMPIPELAASLKRAYNSIYTKLVALKLK